MALMRLRRISHSLCDYKGLMPPQRGVAGFGYKPDRLSHVVASDATFRSHRPRWLHALGHSFSVSSTVQAMLTAIDSTSAGVGHGVDYAATGLMENCSAMMARTR